MDLLTALFGIVVFNLMVWVPIGLVAKAFGLLD